MADLDLTGIETRVLEAIFGFAELHGRFPSIAELDAILPHSVQAITGACDALEASGCVQLAEDEELRILDVTLSATAREGFDEFRQVRGADWRLQLRIVDSGLASTDVIASELVELVRALSAYHISCGGSGLTVEDWEVLLPADQTAGVVP